MINNREAMIRQPMSLERFSEKMDELDRANPEPLKRLTRGVRDPDSIHVDEVAKDGRWDGLRVEREEIHRDFAKFHLTSGRLACSLHRFTRSDLDLGPAHDHPWSHYVTHVLVGGYVEEVFARNRFPNVLQPGLKAHSDGWFSWLERREPGASRRVDGAAVHRIVELLSDEVWTVVTTGPVVRDVSLYHVGADGRMHRAPLSDPENWRPA